MTNISARRERVKPSARPGPEVVEISRLLAELARSGGGGRPEAAGDREDAGPAEGAPSPGVARGAGSLSDHVIRAAIHIHHAGPQTIGELARGLGISQGWASRIVDELALAGYVERTRDAGDRRVVRVGLTAMGDERVGQAAQWRVDAVEAALAGTGPQERAAVAEFLRRFLGRGT